VPLGGLDESDAVAVCVFHGSDQLAPADVLHLLQRLRASVEERLQRLLDIVDVPVADGPVIPWLWPLGSRPMSWPSTLKPT
jgi:hypothetical protein